MGTDLHTTVFKTQTAQHLYTLLAPLGSMVKGHYTDWVESPKAYPLSGMGAANVGPEFTAAEYDALNELVAQERKCISPAAGSNFMQALQTVVIESGRWEKWLLPAEKGLSFSELRPERQEWLLKTGSRYIWTNPRVVDARQVLYHNVERKGIGAQSYVVQKITTVIEKYIYAFNLRNTVDIL